MDISKKKPFFPVNIQLETYLKEFGRIISLPVSYDDLLRYSEGFSLLDKNGEDESEWVKMSGVSDLSRNERQQYVILQLLKKLDDFLMKILYLTIKR